MPSAAQEICTGPVTIFVSLYRSRGSATMKPVLATTDLPVAIVKPRFDHTSATLRVAARPGGAGAFDPRLVLSLAAVYVIWSSTYLAMRVAVVELPPLMMAAMRFFAAGGLMMAVAIRRGATMPPLRDW